MISIHAPVWGATVKFFNHIIYFPYFNSRSRVGSDDMYVRLKQFLIISIHAPVWGATCFRVIPVHQFLFQFTLPCGERQFGTESDTVLEDFNSRSRVGSDQPVFPGHIPYPSISIHAPVWGATLWPELWKNNITDFNSRSRVGSDQKYDIIIKKHRNFNSRSRVGSDFWNS